MRERRVTIVRDWFAGVSLAAFMAWVGVMFAGLPNFLLAVAGIAGFSAILFHMIWKLSERSVGLPATPAKNATTERLRNVLGQLLSSGSNILTHIQSSSERTDRASEIFRKMELADLTYKWDQVAQQVIRGLLGQSYVDQFESRISEKPRRVRTALAPELADYWEAVAWRLDWLDDRMNQMRG